MSVEGWKTKALGSVAEIIMGQSPDSRYYSEEEIGLPFLQGCAEFTSKFPSAVLFCSQVKKIARTGSILFSVRAPVGRTNLTDTDYIIGRGLAALIASQISQDYLHHYLVYSESGFRNNSQGSTFEAINSKELRDWAISFPEFLQEQTQIATILSTIDRAIEQTEALIAKQQRIKTGLMQDLLTKGIDENGNIRSEETHEFKDSPLGRIPVEWELEKLGDVCEIFNNFRNPISALVRETMKGDYPYYGPTGILDYINEYRISGKFVLIGEDGDHFLKFKTQEMTLLINGRYNVNNHAHILKGKDNILTEWLYLFFLHRDITFYLTRQGAGRFKLNKSTLLELPILVPQDLKEQQHIIDVINMYRETQISNVNNFNKLKQLKTGLMQDLLTGKVRVTDLLNQKTAAN